MWTARVVTWMGSLAIAVLLFGVLQAHAGRPLVTDDAYPVELGDVEFEFGIEVETTTQSYSLTAPFSFGFGVTDWLELAIKPSVLYQDDQDASPSRAVT